MASQQTPLPQRRPEIDRLGLKSAQTRKGRRVSSFSADGAQNESSRPKSRVSSGKHQERRLFRSSDVFGEKSELKDTKSGEGIEIQSRSLMDQLEQLSYEGNGDKKRREEFEIRSAASEESESMSRKLKRVTKKLEAMQKVEEQNEKFDQLITHYDTEREILCDLFNVVVEDPEKPWDSLRKRAAEYKSLKKSNSDQLAQIADLQNEVNCLRREKSEMSVKVQSDALEASEKAKAELSARLSTLEQEAEEMRAKTAKSERFSSFLRTRLAICKAISDGQNASHSFICELHKEITGKEPAVLRPLALATFFIIKWRRAAKNMQPLECHASSLLTFSSSVGSNESRMKEEISERINSLSSELLAMKNAPPKEDPKSDNSQKLLEVYKKRCEELQQEIVLSIPNDSYQKLLEKISVIEAENAKLLSENKELHLSLNSILSEDTELKALLSSANQRQKASLSQISGSEETIHDMETEITALRARLKEKTNQILSLERMNCSVSGK